MYCQDCTIGDTTCKDKKAILKRPHRSQLRIENPHDRPKGCVQWTERTKAEVLDIYIHALAEAARFSSVR